MTVGELINRLQRLDKDEPVTIEELLKIINGIYVDNLKLPKAKGKEFWQKNREYLMTHRVDLEELENLYSI